MNHRVANLLEEMVAVSEAYQGLHLKCDHGRILVVGELEFRAQRDDIEICDSYTLELQIPDNYPYLPPVVREVGGRIPPDADHHVQPDGALCLGPPIGVFGAFRKQPTLLRFIEDLLIPCLFWHSYNARGPTEPIGAYSHGPKGIAEYRAETDLRGLYCDIFEVRQVSIVVRLLHLACQDEIEYDIPCPCKSGKPLIVCHGKVLRDLLAMPYLKRGDLALDYWHLKDAWRKAKGVRLR